MRNVILLLGIFTLGFVGCNTDSDNDSNAEDYNLKGLLENYSTNIITPNYFELNQKSMELKSEVSLFIASPSMSGLAQVRTKLLNAQLAYQSCSSFDFGPAISNSLRSVFNTYPTNSSIISQNIISGTYNLNTAGNIAAKGLPAVEFLMYGENITDQEVLDLFTTDNNAANRLIYLQDVVNQMESVSTAVFAEWSVNGYSDVFVNNQGVGVGSSTSLLLNAMVLDFERYIRDGKVGIPLGVRTLGTPVPEKVEALYSKKSLELVKQSIISYKKVFTGTNGNSDNGAGLDDYLKHEGAQTTASNIELQLDAVLEKLDLLTNLQEDVINNKSLVQEAYDEMQKTIVLLKVEMPSALSVLVTYQDSDGD